MQTQFVNLLLIPIKISGRATALSRQKVHLIIRIDFYRRPQRRRSSRFQNATLKRRDPENIQQSSDLTREAVGLRQRRVAGPHQLRTLVRLQSVVRVFETVSGAN